MRSMIKNALKKVIYGPLSPIAVNVFRLVSNVEYRHFTKKWGATGLEETRPTGNRFCS